MRIYCADCGQPLNDKDQPLAIAYCKACYDPKADVEGSFEEAYRAIRERKAAGGLGWTPRYVATSDPEKRTSGFPKRKG